MKKMITLLSFAGIVGLALVAPKNAMASEGYTELRNTIGEDARCWVGSGLMPDQTYRLLVLCRDILYPGGTDIFNYIMWSNPSSGGNPERLGQLGVGKAEFKTKNAFTSLFVTKEKESNPRTPSGTVVMRGNIHSISFLSSADDVAYTNELGEPEATATPAPTRSGLNGLQLGGILGFAGLFGVILVVFFITRR